MPPRLPLCEPCLLSKSYCAACAEKQGKGEVTELDVRVASFIAEHKKELELEHAELRGTLASGKTVFLFTGKNGAPLIGKKGATAAALSKLLGKKIKVIELEGEKSKAIAQTLLPLAPLGINTVYHATGNEFRVRMKKQDADKLPAEQADVEAVCSKILGEKTLLAFE